MPSHTLKVVILAAGFGERFEKSVQDEIGAMGELNRKEYFLANGQIKPKALLKINGQEIVSRLLGQLKNIPNFDIGQDLHLITNKKYFSVFKDWAKRTDCNLNIEHIYSNGVEVVEKRHGAVVDLYVAVERGCLANCDILVLSSDTLFDEFKLKDIVSSYYKGNEGKVVLPAYQEIGATMHKRARVEFESNGGNIKNISEKPQGLDPKQLYWALPAIYLFPAKVIGKQLYDYVKEYSKDLQKVDAPGKFVEFLSQNEETKNEIRVCRIPGKRFDIGDLQGLLETETHFRSLEGCIEVNKK